MARFYIPSLSKQYKKDLKEGNLNEAVVAMLTIVYFILVRRGPKQFQRGLEIGYPNLVDTYGVDAIKAPIKR